MSFLDCIGSPSWLIPMDFKILGIETSADRPETPFGQHCGFVHVLKGCLEKTTHSNYVQHASLAR